MALHDIREVRIPIDLDKPRTLLFDLNAFAELEDKFGSLDQAFQKMQQGSVKATRTLLWAGLLHEDENLTERQVGAMISLTNVEKIMEQITEALTAALPEDTGDAEKGFLQELLIGVAPVLDLIFKPTHLLPPYSFATRSA